LDPVAPSGRVDGALSMLEDPRGLLPQGACARALAQIGVASGQPAEAGGNVCVALRQDLPADRERTLEQRASAVVVAHLRVELAESIVAEREVGMERRQVLHA